MRRRVVLYLHDFDVYLMYNITTSNLAHPEPAFAAGAGILQRPEEGTAAAPSALHKLASLAQERPDSTPLCPLVDNPANNSSGAHRPALHAKATSTQLATGGSTYWSIIHFNTFYNLNRALLFIVHVLPTSGGESPSFEVQRRI